VIVADAVISQATALVAATRISGIPADIADAQTAIAEAVFAYHQADQTHDDTMQCLDVAMPDGNTQHICPALGPYEEMTRAQVTAAQAALDAAQSQLAALRGPTGASIAAAEANVQTALAQRDAMQAQLDLARAGTTAATIAIAEATVRETEAALATARNLLADLTLTAPFDAIVSDVAVHPGDIPAPGGALVTLATLDALHIRVKDLTELDIGRVTEGQSVRVTFDARPDAIVNGHVTRIDRQGQDYLGDVIYPVYIELDTMPAWAMWGMTAKLRIKNQRIKNGRIVIPQLSRLPFADSTFAHSVFAEAVIEPERWAEVRFTVPGKVVEVLAQPGMSVQTGDVLARLDATHEDAAVRQAEAKLATAQAQLVLAQTGPRPETIAAAEAQVGAAEGNVARAVAARNQLTAAGREAQVAAVRAQLEAAQAERRQLEAQWQWAKDGGADERAQDLWEQITVVDQRIAAAQARLASIPDVFAAQVQAADAGVHVAEAQLAAAQAELTQTQAGPRAEEVAVAQAAVRQAEAALAAAQATLTHTELRAPFAGTVTQVLIETGNFVTLERPVVVIATLNRLHVQTRDVLENDVGYVSVGQPVTVKVDALPEATFAGYVAQIEAQGVLYRGDVTYPVIITLDTPSPALLWGMKAVVEITP
ncbi:MAG: HlyD family secretion protein, partial [Anaerolineae bacterium]